MNFYLKKGDTGSKTKIRTKLKKQRIMELLQGGTTGFSGGYVSRMVLTRRLGIARERLHLLLQELEKEGKIGYDNYLVWLKEPAGQKKY